MLTVVSSVTGERDQRNRAWNARKGIERALPSIPRASSPYQPFPLPLFLRELLWRREVGG